MEKIVDRFVASWIFGAIRRVVFSVCSVLQELSTFMVSVIAGDWLLDITALHA